MKAERQIEDEAAEWVIKIGDPYCTGEQLEALNDWLRQDVEHARQFDELRELWHGIDLPIINLEPATNDHDANVEVADSAVDVAAACRGIIRAYHERYVQDRQGVEGLVVDTYARLVKHARPPPHGVRSTLGFLLAAARDIALARLYKSSVIPIDHLADIEDLNALDVDQEVQVIVETDRILSAFEAVLAGLPSKTRDVFILFKMQKRSAQEVARSMNMGVAEVRRHLREAAIQIERVWSRVGR